uniref:Uncharacterized protein n=1 Tax=Rhizophora mucronata TaxID=61149 RepID=A0A2P2NBU4_RHIMU
MINGNHAFDSNTLLFTNETVSKTIGIAASNLAAKL